MTSATPAPREGLIAVWLAPFRSGFSRAVWRHVPRLVAGALLAPGRRTVTAALHVLGLAHAPNFARYHRVLSRDRWSSRALARRLLARLIEALVPQGPVIIALDDTLERRWGKKIKARGIYRDPVRSSKGHFVKASGLRWLALALLAPIPWAGRVWALPFLTVLAPSERYAQQHRHGRHKRLTDWARQALLQTARWLKGRRLVAVADQSFAALDLLAAVARHLCLITRLRLDAALYDFPPPPRPGTRGRRRVRGARRPSLKARLADPATPWRRVTLTGWYGRRTRRLDIVSDTALWYHHGERVAIRYVLVRDGEGEFAPQAFLATDLAADPLDILRWFVRRWSTEVTFAEARRHLGLETQRQWTDQAIRRTTPALLGLFSLVALWAGELHQARALQPRSARWYGKTELTFSDALAAVRRELWRAEAFGPSRRIRDDPKTTGPLLNRLIELACYPA